MTYIYIYNFSSLSLSVNRLIPRPHCICVWEFCFESSGVQDRPVLLTAAGFAVLMDAMTKILRTLLPSRLRRSYLFKG